MSTATEPAATRATATERPADRGSLAALCARHRLACCLVVLAVAAPCEAAEPLGWLATVQADVRIVGAGGSRPAAAGLPLFAGDAVESGVVGRAKLLLGDGSVVNLGDASRLVLPGNAGPSGSTRAHSILRLERGILRTWVHARPAPAPLRVLETATARIEVEGGEVAVRIGASGTELLVFAGAAATAGRLGAATRVEAGQRSLVAAERAAGPALGTLPAELARAVEDTRVASRLRFESLRRATLQTGRVRREVALEKMKNSTERKRKAAAQEAPKSSGDLSSTVGSGGDLDPLIAPAGVLKVTGHTGRRF